MSKSDDHEWQEMIKYRCRHQGCPFCTGKRISKTNSLLSKLPKLATEWHPKKNGTLTPEKITYGSGKVVWWLCPEGHEYQAKPNTRTSGYEKICPHSQGCIQCYRERRKDNNLGSNSPHYRYPINVSL